MNPETATLPADSRAHGTEPRADDSELWINSAEVRRLCGNISNMSLHRWLADDRLAFPRPSVVNSKRYWIKGDVLAWRVAQAQGGA